MLQVPPAQSIFGRLWPLTSGQTVEQGGDRRQADRYVQQKDPAPREVVGQQAADRRPDGAGRGEADAVDHLPLPSLTRREHVAHHDQRARLDAASANPLQPAKHHQQRHARGEAAQQRPDAEQGDGHDKDPPSAKQVGQLADHGDRRGRSKEIGREDPPQEVGALQRVDDVRQRRRDHGLVYRRQHGGHRQRAERRDELAIPRSSADAYWVHTKYGRTPFDGMQPS